MGTTTERGDRAEGRAAPRIRPLTHMCFGVAFSGVYTSRYGPLEGTIVAAATVLSILLSTE